MTDTDLKLIWLQIKCVLIIVGTFITLPFAHMAGDDALTYWAHNVTDMYDRTFAEMDKLLKEE